jgi:cyclopropane-fatty-acyl-phospholipid synthase
MVNEEDNMDAALSTTRAIYDELVAVAGEQLAAVRTWTGDTWGPVDAPATLVLRHPGALRAALIPPTDLSAGEAYVHDDIDIEGDMLAALEFASRIDTLRRRPWQALQLLRRLRRLPNESRRGDAVRPAVLGRLHSRQRDRKAVTHHYDTGNDFFGLFLDPALVYSCAAFLHPDESLEAAQARKLDLICRKLQLAPDQEFLDIGCGWGALVCHAAAQYGVHATGITLSAQQATQAERRAKELGVEDRVTIKVEDYRDVAGEFDAIASVGMFEHVGSGHLDRYFGQVRKLLRPHGAFLNHGIVTRDRSTRRRRPTFVNTYVFPDGELVPIDDVVGAAEGAGFEVRDAEALRTSYGLTLRRWVSNLEANHDAARRVAGETVYRIWRLYMAGSVLAFEKGALSVYQLVLHSPDRAWTYGRRHLLAADDG